MRISTLLLMICVFSAYAEKTYSQDAKINIQMNNVQLGKILNAIESQTSYLFIYNNQVKIDRKVSVNAKNQSVATVLDKLLKGIGIYYKLEGNHIILSKQSIKISNKTAESMSTMQKKNKISGTIVDTKGEPIIGANVHVKGLSVGTITDLDGNFFIDVDPKDVLEVTYIGYLKQDVAVGNQNNMRIILSENTQLLNEVIVVGYGSQKKANLTGAISSVDSEVLEDRPIPNLAAGLQGTIANLNITMNNGAPGGETKFNIRGATNLDESAPLVLVDGIEMNVNLINPTDIANVVVLKDAASAAIYGARAAFGVILITTKQGEEGSKPQISFNASYSINKPTVVPKGVNSMQYTRWMNDANMTTNGYNYFDEETMQHIEAYYNDPINNLPVFIKENTPTQYTYVGNTNWYEEVNKSTYQLQQYDINISGGGKEVKYFTSAAVMQQGGLSRWADEDYKRYNILQNVSYKPIKWLEVGIRSSLSVTDQDTGASNKYGVSSVNLTVTGDLRPLMPLRLPDGHFSGSETAGLFTNPAAWQSQGGYEKLKKNDIRTTGSIKITPLEGLGINLDYTYNYFNYSSKDFRKEYYDYDALGNATLFPHTTPNQVKHTRNESFYNILNAYVEYTKLFKEKHNFKAMIGFNQESKRITKLTAAREGLISNEIPSLGLATGNRTTEEEESKWSMRGVFFRLNYDYESKYLLEFNGRYDGSSRFPKNDRFKFFPSVSGGWRISSENFWDPVRSLVNSLKIRASYGVLGNQVVKSAYPYIANYTTQETDYLFGGEKEMGVIPPGLISPSLTWESVNQYDIGIDIDLLDSRLTATFDYYSRTTKDMLALSKTLPSIIGAKEPLMNAADLRTNGWELGITWRQTLSNKLSYHTSFILSDYTSEITKFDNPTRNINQHYKGQKMGDIWGFVTEGLFVTDAEAAAWDQSEIVGHKQLAGDIKFADLDGKPGISKGKSTVDDPGDRKIIGNSTPHYSFGMRGGAEWKGFDFTIFFQGIMKRDVLAQNKSLYINHYSTEWAVPVADNMDYWREENVDAFYPRARFNGREVLENQTRYLLDGSYIRLKQLALGYTIPRQLTSKAGISRLRVYFNADNLWEHSGIPSMFDPEIAQTNLYPLMRSFAFGLNLTF